MLYFLVQHFSIIKTLWEPALLTEMFISQLTAFQQHLNNSFSGKNNEAPGVVYCSFAYIFGLFID